MKIKYTEVAERLKSFGCNIAEGDELTIQFAINGTEEYIKNFCNLPEVPDELHYTAVDMCCGTYLKTKRSLGIDVCDSIDFDAEAVKSITEGDVSVTYNSDGKTGKAALFDALLNKLCNRNAELVTFRKLRW